MKCKNNKKSGCSTCFNCMMKEYEEGVRLKIIIERLQILENMYGSNIYIQL